MAVPFWVGASRQFAFVPDGDRVTLAVSVLDRVLRVVVETVAVSGREVAVSVAVSEGDRSLRFVASRIVDSSPD